MFLRPLKRWIVVSASAIIMVAGGCHLCHTKQNAEVCQQPELGCPVPENGYVNEQEKDPKKARKNAKKDAAINADGCSPQCERIPLLKRIADKENLASDIPVIKAAAKIKHEEEMCQQKVKAVRYLGTIGCCCYDKDGEVSKALLDALNDCLPAVRLAAVQAIGGCVCGEQRPRTCCTEEIAERLAAMAWETDDKGCLIEPELRIREWAAYVSQYCPKKPKKSDDPKKKDTVDAIEGDSSDKDKDSDGDDVPAAPAPSEPQASRRDRNSSSVSKIGRNAIRYDRLVHHQTICQPVAHVAVPDVPLVFSILDDSNTPVATTFTPETLGAQLGYVTSTDFFVPPSPDESQRFVSMNQVSYSSPVVVETRPATIETRPVTVEFSSVNQNSVVQPDMTRVAVTSNPNPIARRENKDSRRLILQGQIESVDLAGETATVRLAQNKIAAVTSRVHVVHKYALGRIQSIGEFEVLSIGPGFATIRPVAGTSLRKISIGDTATVFCG